LLERVSLAGIARVTGVSRQWLQTYVELKCRAQKQAMEMQAPKRLLIVQSDCISARHAVTTPVRPHGEPEHVQIVAEDNENAHLG
jgi:hypothetical protein